MHFYKYIIVFISLVICTNLKNNCFSQTLATSAIVGGPRQPIINTQVTYFPVFKNAAGNVVPTEQVGVTSIYYYLWISGDGPDPLFIQSGINYKVTWRCLGYSEVDCSIYTWDNYFETGPTGMQVRPQPDPLTPGCPNLTNQTVYYEELPADINVSPVKGGDCTDAEGSNNYLYQWQWSADNVFFQDIPNTNTQNLTFTGNMHFANNQSPGTTFYVQRKTTCGAEVQYTNSSSITYTATSPVYARLELIPSDSTYWEDEYDIEYEKMVATYIRFYSDKACTIPYTLPANVNFKFQSCLHEEYNGTITDNCSTTTYYYTANAGTSEYQINDGFGFERYNYWYNPSADAWYLYKYTSEYTLTEAGSSLIKPTVIPPRWLRFGGVLPF